MIYLAGGTDASILVNCYHPSGKIFFSTFYDILNFYLKKK